LTLVADGHVSELELDVLEHIGTYRRLGIDRDAVHEVLRGLCEDLLQSHHPQWSDACQVEPVTLQRLMAEIEDPTLRMEVLDLCVAVAEADDHVADGESLVLVCAVDQWGMHHRMLNAR
jgi:hypothetical protein